MGRSEHRPDSVLARQHEVDALQLRIGGASLAQIAQKLEVSEVSAWRIVKRALRRLEALTAEAAKEWRELVLQRLEMLAGKMMIGALRGEPRAVDALLRITKQERELLGLDGPQQVEVTHFQGGDAREALRSRLSVIAERLDVLSGRTDN